MRPTRYLSDYVLTGDTPAANNDNVIGPVTGASPLWYGTVSGTLSIGSATVTGSATANLRAGMTITGTGIPASTTIASITNATTFVMSQVATAAGAQTITYSPHFTSWEVGDLDLEPGRAGAATSMRRLCPVPLILTREMLTDPAMVEIDLWGFAENIPQSGEPLAPTPFIFAVGLLSDAVNVNPEVVQVQTGIAGTNNILFLGACDITPAVALNRWWANIRIVPTVQKTALFDTSAVAWKQLVRASVWWQNDPGLSGTVTANVVQTYNFLTAHTRDWSAGCRLTPYISKYVLVGQTQTAIDHRVVLSGALMRVVPEIIRPSLSSTFASSPF